MLLWTVESSHNHLNKLITFNKIFNETNKMGIGFCLRYPN